MTESVAAGVSELAVDEMEQLSGGIAPGWWWFFTYVASESGDFVRGVRDGYGAA